MGAILANLSAFQVFTVICARQRLVDSGMLLTVTTDDMCTYYSSYLWLINLLSKMEIDVTPGDRMIAREFIEYAEKIYKKVVREDQQVNLPESDSKNCNA